MPTTRLEFKGDWKLNLSFEFSREMIQRDQMASLHQRLTQANTAQIPVNVFSYYEISHMWRSGNGAAVNRSAEVGSVERLTLGKIDLETTAVWLDAKIALFENPTALNRLTRNALVDPLATELVSKEDFVVFPRMMVNAHAAQSAGVGQRAVPLRFESYGPILALDCVYGFVRKSIFESVADADYAKKHHLDFSPKK